MEYRDTKDLMIDMGLTRAWELPRICLLNFTLESMPKEMLIKDGNVVFGNACASLYNKEDRVVTSCTEPRYLIENDLDKVIQFTWDYIQDVVQASKVIAGARGRTIKEWLLRQPSKKLSEGGKFEKLGKLDASSDESGEKFKAFKADMKKNAIVLPESLPVPNIEIGQKFFKVYENGLFDNKGFTFEVLSAQRYQLLKNDENQYRWQAGLCYEGKADVRHWISKQSGIAEGLAIRANNCRLFATQQDAVEYLKDTMATATSKLSTLGSAPLGIN